MNFKIKHKIPGRIRVHMGQSRMSFDQADTLQYFLETQPGVTKAIVYEQTQDAVIEYDGELKELMEALKSFHYEDVQLPDSVRSSSGRALNVEYKEKLIGHVAKRLFTKYMLPLPIRNVYTIWKAFRYIKKRRPMPFQRKTGSPGSGCDSDYRIDSAAGLLDGRIGYVPAWSG